MSLIRQSHVAHIPWPMDESCPSFVRVMLHIFSGQWTSHVPHSSESCCTYSVATTSKKLVGLVVSLEVVSDFSRFHVPDNVAETLCERKQKSHNKCAYLCVLLRVYMSPRLRDRGGKNKK